MALRFLNAAKRVEETNKEDRKIQLLKEQSVLLTSSMDYKTFLRDKNGKKTNIFLETQKNPNRISQLLQKVKGERFSLASQDESPIKRMSIDSPFISHMVESYDEEKKDEFNEKDQQKPIFIYLPQEEEIRSMIMDVLKRIAGEREFFKTVNIPKRRRKI